MGHAVWVYGAVAILIVASSGPVLASVRDASLADFASLDEPRTLNDFPFIKAVESYLPPIVVDWLIIRPDQDLDLPADVGYRLDRDGRVILVWPDGCEETEEQFRTASACAPPSPADCAADPDAEGCPPPGSVDCPAGQIPDGRACIPDPACADDADERPDTCLPLEEETEPEPRCPPTHTPTTDDGCLLIATHQLRRIAFQGTEADHRYGSAQLRAPYENLSLEITFAGLPAPSWSVTLYDDSGTRVCWERASDPDERSCEITQPGTLTTGHRSYNDDGALRPLPAGGYTLFVEYDPGAGAGKSLEVRLFGKPAAHDAS